MMLSDVSRALGRHRKSERIRIIREAKRQLREIKQLLIDVRSWNDNHPDQKPIEADPDGQMTVIKVGLERMLLNEKQIAKLSKEKQ